MFSYSSTHKNNVQEKTHHINWLLSVKKLEPTHFENLPICSQSQETEI